MKTITEYINESLNESLTTSKSEITGKISAWLPGDIICFDKDEYIDWYGNETTYPIEHKYHVVIKNEKNPGKYIYLQPVDDKNSNKKIGEVEQYKITKWSFAAILTKKIDDKKHDIYCHLHEIHENNKNPLWDIKSLKNGVRSALMFFENYVWWYGDIGIKKPDEFFNIDDDIRKKLKSILDYTKKNSNQMAKLESGILGKWNPQNDNSNRSQKLWDKFRGESGSDYPVLIVLKDKKIPGPYLFVNYNDNITSINNDIQNFIDLFDREYVDVWVQVEQ